MRRTLDNVAVSFASRALFQHSSYRWTAMFLSTRELKPLVRAVFLGASARDGLLFLKEHWTRRPAPAATDSNI